MRKNHVLILLFLIFPLTLFSVRAQQIKYRLFKDLDALLKKAKVVHADLLAPGNFEEGKDYYDEAKESLQDDDPLEEIKEKISKADFFLHKAIRYAESAKSFFKNALKAREDALKVFADSLARKEWEKGEDKFNDACSDFEDGENEDAQEEGFEAEKIYRKAELTAIKRIYLDKARLAYSEAVKEDAEKYAHETLRKARQLIYNAEKELENQRYDNEYARELASDAYSQARHALFLTELFKKADKEDWTLEKLSLFWEEPLRKIAAPFNIKPYFDHGPDSLTNEILGKIILLKTSLKEVDYLKKKNETLKKEFREYKKECETTRKNLEKIRTYGRRIKEIKNIFRPSEAEIFTRNCNVVIRLRKLNFSPGSAVIRPEYFGLLAKVIKAIEKFPDALYVVEGHTDASGKADKNLTISQKRAEAVYAFILANSNIDKKHIYAVGYGESLPVASNETSQGKARNRRIEIVIKPAYKIFE